jgi:hypothetical protein
LQTAASVLPSEGERGLKSLQTLNLRDPQVTDAGVKKLELALPSCDISK